MNVNIAIEIDEKSRFIVAATSRIDHRAARWSSIAVDEIGEQRLPYGSGRWVDEFIEGDRSTVGEILH